MSSFNITSAHLLNSLNINIVRNVHFKTEEEEEDAVVAEWVVHSWGDSIGSIPLVMSPRSTRNRTETRVAKMDLNLGIKT